MDVDLLSDIDLLQRIAENDNKAFRMLFLRYKDRFYAAALKMTHSTHQAEEIVQQVFVLLWQRRTHLQEVEKPESYLFTIVYNTISRQFKKIAAEKAMKAKIRGKTTPSENTTEQFLFEKESRQWLQKIANQLPSQQRLIYHLSKEKGMSRKEIAEQLGISPNTVKNHLLKAMKFIRGHWEQVVMIIMLLWV